MRGLKGKRIIVAGGGTGMGAALAERLIEEGANLVVADINEPALNKLVPELVKKGGNAIAVPFDLSDAPSITNLVKRAMDHLGGIDGLANTGADLSAQNLGNDTNIFGMDAKIWDRTLKVNLIGHGLLMQAVIPHMTKSGGGSILSVSSGAAYAGLPFMPAYGASKAGLHALVRHVARVCGKDKIRCNAVAPGIVLTEGAQVNMTESMKSAALRVNPLPRLGEADDLASAMAFLLSDDSSWITGQVLTVNGGNIFRD